MKNLDSLREKMKNTSEKLAAAMESRNEEQISQCLEEYGKAYLEYHDDGRFEQLREQMDNNVLTARGIRQITSEERAYAEALIKAHKSGNVKQALSDVPPAMPQTIINTVLDDIRTNHPLFNYIDIRVTEFNVKVIYTEDGAVAASWGPIDGKIKTELSATIKTIDGTQFKLTAFLPVPKSHIDFSAEWLVSLIISMLTEAFALGLEDGIINGTGKDRPIGMTKDLKGAVVEGVYPDKKAEKLTEITPQTYLPLVAKLSTTESGKARTLSEVMLICNPEDYLTKICPATTVRRADGEYSHDVFPFPTDTIPSAKLAKGKAILGVPNGYIQTVGADKNGSIDYDDSVQFLEDNRVYIIKGYGNGRPKDNNSFIMLDISELVPVVQKVQIVGEVATSAKG